MDQIAAAILAQGQAAWPAVSPPSATLANFVANHSGGDLPVYASDVYLALACAERIPAAITVLERQFLSEVGGFVGRIDGSPQFIDEVKQRLRERLLVGPRPRIADYSGSGPLGAWLRVLSIRLAIDIQRDADGPSGADDVSSVATLALDPELQMIRNEHRAAVERSLREAMSRLSPRDRNVLTMYFAGSWSLDQIGKAYGVHRATVCRWIRDIRERLLSDLASDLRATLGLTVEEVHSYARMLRSRLDAGLSEGLADR